jgi:hypothetical protein
MMLAGEHTKRWDGLSDHRASAPSGLYFITLGTSEGRKTQRVAVVR